MLNAVQANLLVSQKVIKGTLGGAILIRGHSNLEKTFRLCLKCLCIEIFGNFFIGSYERRLKTKKKALYRLLISASVPEI